MEKLFLSRDRSIPIPIYSTVHDHSWVSLNAHDFNQLPSESLDYINVPFKDLSKATSPTGQLMEMDFKRGPCGSAWGMNDYEDFLNWVFSNDRIPVFTHTHDVDVREDNSFIESPYGYSLDTEWRDRCLDLGLKLSIIIDGLVHLHPLYGMNGYNHGTGPMPPFLREGRLKDMYNTELDAVDEGAIGRQTILSQLTFIAWFIACEPDWMRCLGQEQIALVQSLRLQDRH
ncbi:hypothetical protein C8J57DRAFT_1501881 [Mycena rebaudengoi]|nr:hypothetical protein C8J57DRAFT_1501881 [Mycena rebaudengoi]